MAAPRTLLHERPDRVRQQFDRNRHPSHKTRSQGLNVHRRRVNRLEQRGHPHLRLASAPPRSRFLLRLPSACGNSRFIAFREMLTTIFQRLLTLRIPMPGVDRAGIGVKRTKIIGFEIMAGPRVFGNPNTHGLENTKNRTVF